MAKIINVGGRLHSTEVGNVLTGANEILDDVKGKKQNVINSEVSEELTRLEQSKQDNLTFDNTPTEDSTNPVTSGGVYAADKTLSDAIEAILLLIPSAATALNQLADMAFVNSSVSTATATFRGTYNVVTDLELAYDATHEQIATKLGQVIATADNNDYAFVQVPVSATSTDIRRTERYKFNGTVWGYEYDLNTSGFTAAQWEAINSGITALLVSKLMNLPTAEVLATMFAAKQNVLTFDAAPTALSTNPVYSGGVYSAIKAITDLIPEEATNLNQLADKAYVLASILAATPAFKGQFTSLVDLQNVSSPKNGDIGIVRTKDNDGKDVFTFYQYLNNQWNVYFSLSYHPQTKPATTGTTGDYPYNGMGRVEVPMNIVEGVNTLTQDMFYKGEIGSRVPNTNTIFVIQYDYELAENITIPANCVLEFEGGSISGNYTLDLNDCQIVAPNICVFKGVTLTGKTNDIFNLCWLIEGDDITDVINNLPNTIKKIVFNSDKTYYIHNAVIFDNISYLDWNVTVYYNGTVSNISVIKLIRLSNGATVKFGGWFSPIDETTAVDQVNDNTNVVGLEICNTHNATFYIGNIGYFNENVRVSGIGQGCCNNKFFFSSLFCGNRQLRIYQENANGSVGWANENYFYGGHFQVYSSWASQGKKATAIHIEGAQREGGTDSYNGCNALTFNCFNFEGYGAAFNGYTVYAKNIQGSSFMYIRNEGGVKFAKLVGDCRNIKKRITSEPSTDDLSECVRSCPYDITDFPMSDVLDIPDTSEYIKHTRHASYCTSDLLSDKGGHMWWNTGTDTNGVTLSYEAVAGHVIVTNQGNLAFIKDGALVDVFDGGNKLPFMAFVTGKGYNIVSGTKSAAVYIPSGLDVDYVFLGAYGSPYVRHHLYVATSGRLEIDKRDMPKQGAQADIPTEAAYGIYSLGVGQEYYCTDTKKKLICDGTNWLTTDGDNP